MSRKIHLVPHDVSRWDHVPDLTDRARSVSIARSHDAAQKQRDKEMRKAFREAERVTIKYENYMLGCNGRKLSSPLQGRVNTLVVRNQGCIVARKGVRRRASA